MKWTRCGHDVVGKDSAGCGSGIHSAKAYARGSTQADPDNRAGKPEYGLTRGLWRAARVILSAYATMGYNYFCKMKFFRPDMVMLGFTKCRYI